MPHLAWWQWILGSTAAYMIGIAKTAAPGVGSLMVPLMVLTTGDARQAAGWTLPTLSTADIYAVIYWCRREEALRDDPLDIIGDGRRRIGLKPQRAGNPPCHRVHSAIDACDPNPSAMGL